MKANSTSISNGIYLAWMAACKKTAATYAKKMAALRAYRDHSHPDVQAAIAEHVAACSDAHAIEAGSPESIAYFKDRAMRVDGGLPEGGAK